MCGICGIYNLENKPVAEEKIRFMMHAMKHRGPDDEGLYINKNVGLGFVRLSIIDLSQAGHQPMISEDSRYILTFNGELYNYIELREDLKSLGHVFKTNTDTEVLLKSYLQWGDACLDRFNGMWAFVIYDKIENKLFGARDRFGVKPFYYLYNKQSFVYASDINAIVGLDKSELSINKQTMLDYLVFNRTDQTENTFYQQIRKIPHGYKFYLDCDGLVLKQWYNLKMSITKPFMNPEEYLDVFTSSINLRLRSDVPVGICLSGGLDSSSIVSTLISKFGKNDIHTFSAVYSQGEKGDESKFINLYKHQLTNMHYTTPTAQSLFDETEDFINAIGEPVASTSPYAQYKVMQLAKEHVVVTLDGQGADEQLAGYHYFFGFYFKELLQRADLAKLGKEMILYLNQHKSVFGIKSMIYFLLPSSSRTKLRVSEFGYLNPDFVSQYLATNQVSDNLYSSKSLQEALLNHFEFKLEHLLKWEDRNSMHFSLEARVPFLDYRLVERTLATKSEMIIKNGMTKHILRQAMKGILPEEIRLRQDKIGFGTPQDEWFRTPIWKTRITEILSLPVLSEYIDLTKAQSLYKKHLLRKTHAAKEIWKWVNMYYWMNQNK